MSENQAQSEDAKVWRAFFIDSENGIDVLLNGFAQLHPYDMIVVFHRNNISNKIREQLECGPAQVDWVKCGDPKLKNSMDFQLVTELTARLAMDRFDEGYVVSGDKGFRAAVHHLQEQPIAQGHELACVRDILHGICLSSYSVLSHLDQIQSSEDIQHCLELVLSKNKARKIMPVLTDVILREHGVAVAQGSPAETELAVYEVPCEAVAVSCHGRESKSLARKALHGFMRFLYAVRNVGSAACHCADVRQEIRS